MIKAGVLSNIRKEQRRESADANVDRRTLALESADLNREKMVALLRFKQEQRRAYCILPFALLFFAFTVTVVLVHSEPGELFDMEAGLVDMYVTDGVQTINSDSPVKFMNVQSPSDAFDWLELTLLPALLVQTDYNGDLKPMADWGYDATRYNRVIGAARVAVYNTERADCALSEYDEFYPHCFPEDSPANNQYASDQTRRRLSSGSGSGSGSGSASTAGAAETVDDFFVDVLTAEAGAYNVLATRKADGWISRATHSLTVEFGVYNGELGVLGVVVLTLSFTRGGRVVPTYAVSAVKMDPYDDPGVYAYDALWLAGLAAVLFAQLRELARAARSGRPKAYVTWFNAVDATLLLFAFLILVDWIDVAERSSSVDLSSYTQGVDFASDVDGMAELEAMVLSLVDIAADVKSLRLYGMVAILLSAARVLGYFAYQPRLAQLTDTLAAAVVGLSHFAVLLSLILTAFTVSGHALFGQQLKEFSTLSRTSTTLFEVVFGDFDYDAMRVVDSTGATIYFWAFQLVTSIVLINLVLSILLDAYAAVSRVSSHSQTIPQEFAELGAEVARRARYACGRQPTDGRRRDYTLFASTRKLLDAVTNGSLKDHDRISADHVGEALGMERRDAARLMRQCSLHHIIEVPSSDASGEESDSDSDDEVDLKMVMKAMKGLQHRLEGMDDRIEKQRRSSEAALTAAGLWPEKPPEQLLAPLPAGGSAPRPDPRPGGGGGARVGIAPPSLPAAQTATVDGPSITAGQP